VRDLVAANGRVAFTAPGDDWSTGTASRYEVYGSDRPITQDTLRTSRRLLVSTAVLPAGRRVALDVPKARYYAVRAVDDAGNLGPLQLRALVAVGPERPFGPLPTTGGSEALTLLALGLLAAALPITRRRPRPRSSTVEHGLVDR
jgi:hypothetical protein